MNDFDQALKQQIAQGLRWAAEGLDRDLRPIGVVLGVPLLADLQNIGPERRGDVEADLVAWLQALGMSIRPDPLREAVRAYIEVASRSGWTNTTKEFLAMKEAL